CRFSVHFLSCGLRHPAGRFPYGSGLVRRSRTGTMNTKQNALRVGIAGYGTVGKIRHRVADEHPELSVVAVCDQTFVAPTVKDGVRCVTNYEQLLNEELDILFVCLPNYLAPEATIAGLDRDLHVFCEKPPGRDLSDLERVMLCERRHPGKKL